MGIMQFMDRAAPLALDPAIALLGNEEQGLAIDFAAMRGYIRDRVTGANNWLGDPNAKLAYASPSAKWIWNAFGGLVSGTTLRCDHDPASLDSSLTPLNSIGIGAGAVVNKSIVLASGAFTYPVGEVVRITDAADISKWILGRVVSWTAGTKTLVVAGYAASAAYVAGSSWKVIVALGIRVESQRTNLWLNSAVGVTQNVTVTAGAHTLSFYGPGTITLSGAFAGSLVGSASGRSTLTFTPSAGTLTATVTGSVTLVNLEVGAFATSYIPTSTAQVTRAADDLSLLASLFPYSASSGLLAVDCTPNPVSSDMVAAVLRGAAISSSILLRSNTATADGIVRNAAVIQADLFVAHSRSRTKSAIFYAQDDFRLSVDSGTPVKDTSGTPPAATVLQIGASTGSTSHLNGWVRNIRYIPRATVTDAELQAWAA